MPAIIPVLAAAGSIYAGATAIAAGSALIGGMLVAGGALSLAGTVTGNKKLSQIGSIVSLVGGVSGLASGAWSTAADAAASESVSGMDLAADAGAGGANSIDAAAVAAGGEAATSGVDAYGAGSRWGYDTLSAQGIDPTAGTAPDALSAENMAALDPAAGTTAPPDATFVDPGTTSQAPGAPQAGQPPGAKAFDPAAGQEQAPMRMGQEAPADAAAKPVAQQTAARPGVQQVDKAAEAGDSFWGKAKGTVKDAMAWMKENPTTTKVAAGMLSGAMQSYQRNQGIQDQFDQQQRLITDQRTRLNQSILGPNGQGLLIPKWRPSGQGG